MKIGLQKKSKAQLSVTLADVHSEQIRCFGKLRLIYGRLLVCTSFGSSSSLYRGAPAVVVVLEGFAVAWFLLLQEGGHPGAFTAVSVACRPVQILPASSFDPVVHQRLLVSGVFGQRVAVCFFFSFARLSRTTHFSILAERIPRDVASLLFFVPHPANVAVIRFLRHCQRDGSVCCALLLCCRL